MRACVYYIAFTLLIGLQSITFANDNTAPTLKDEAPTALNIVPWKKTESALQEQSLRASPVLDQVLEPIDRKTLKQEIEFHKKNHQ